VAARLRGKDLHVVVADTGVGIPPGLRREIFKPGVGKGMGLGLSNVNQRLVGLYGENYGLRVRSVPGRGTVVRVVVPVRRD